MRDIPLMGTSLSRYVLLLRTSRRVACSATQIIADSGPFPFLFIIGDTEALQYQQNYLFALEALLINFG